MNRDQIDIAAERLRQAVSSDVMRRYRTHAQQQDMEAIIDAGVAALLGAAAGREAGSIPAGSTLGPASGDGEISTAGSTPASSTNSVSVGTRVRIKPNAFMFAGKEAIIAYVGEMGNVSVYLADSPFDECLPLRADEYEVLP